MQFGGCPFGMDSFQVQATPRSWLKSIFMFGSRNGPSQKNGDSY